jgi:hypothetical protein
VKTAAEAMLMPVMAANTALAANRRNAETAAYAPQQLVCNVERIFADIGYRYQQAHQHK